MNETLRDSLKSNPSKHFFLLYQIDNDDEDIETTLMDSLLHVSNIESPNPKNSQAERKRARKSSSERGFQGTLLQSSTTAKTSGEQNKPFSPIDADSNSVRKRPRSNTIISDDENNESQTATTTAGKDVVSDSSDGEVAITSNEIGDDQKMKLVSQLVELTGSQNESACFEAISWAIEAYKGNGKGQIIDGAFAKFIDITKS